MQPIDSYFKEAEKEWNLKTLYVDLASAKGKRLTPMEKLHLRGLLCGHSPAEIAEILQKNVSGVETDLSATVYRYVKSLCGKTTNKIGNWRDICEWLECSGYHCQTENEFNHTNNNISDKNMVNITNVRFENNEIQVGIQLQISIPVPGDLIIRGLENNN
jgi:hypothetical protein